MTSFFLSEKSSYLHCQCWKICNFAGYLLPTHDKVNLVPYFRVNCWINKKCIFFLKCQVLAWGRVTSHLAAGILSFDQHFKEDLEPQNLIK